MFKPLCLVCALLLVAACDDKAAPPAAPASPTGEQPPTPRTAVQAPPDLQIEVKPAPQQAPEAKPEVKISIAKPPAKAAEDKARLAQKVKEIEEVELSEPKLDLSLPDDWAKELEASESAPSLSLLPPLFSEPAPAVHMSGRLITSEEDDEQLIEGAEIQFEFKR